jgi:hypothetical protein
LELAVPSGKVLLVGATEDADAVAASLVDANRFGELFHRHHGAIWAFLARTAGATSPTT